MLSLMRGQHPGLFTGDLNLLQKMLKFHHIVENAKAFLDTLPAAEMNPELMEFLKAHSVFCAAHRQAVQGGFSLIVNILKNNHIDFLVFKGIYLEKAVYPSDTIRHYADHDILVRREDLSRTEKLFLENGFAPQASLFNNFDIDICIQKGYPRALAHRKARYLQIDLHTRLSIAPGPLFLDPEECWNNPLVVNLEGHQVETLRPETAFLHLCWHSLKHSFCRMLWMQDLKFFLSKYYVLDKPEFLRLVKKHRAEKIVCTALNLLTKVYNDPSPCDIFLSSIRKSPSVESRYFRLPEIFEPRREISARTRVMRDVAVTSGWARKLRYLGQAIFPQPESVESLEGKIHSRLHWRYIISRFRTLAAAFIDFQKFKK